MTSPRYPRAGRAGYDSLGRLTAEANPESGSTSYVYDTDSTCGTYHGDRVKRVDAVGNTTCYGYDAVHRVTSITTTSGTYASVTPAKRFIYDSATVNGSSMGNAAGHLAEAYTCTPVTCSSLITDLGFSYSARGEILTALEATPNSGGYYASTASYWANGSLDQLSAPGMPTLTYNPDGEGRVSTVTASSGQNPVSSTSYNAGSGLPTGVTFGSGDSDAFGYDAMGRMTSYQFNVGSQSVAGQPAWNANGTLQQLAITDPFSSNNQQTCGYSYDDLARIMGVNCVQNPSSTANWAQTFSFDAFGNISKTAGSGVNGPYSFLPTYDTSTNRYSTLPASTPSYDYNGNLQADGFHSYTCDADGHAASLGSVGMTYDALGRMVEQAWSSTSHVQLLYDPMGRQIALMLGSTFAEGRVPLVAGATANYVSSGLRAYFHPDYLGGLHFSSTPSQTKWTDTFYGPYGEMYSSSSGETIYGGMAPDVPGRLWEAMSREYHAVQGRWLTPDPAGLAAVDPTNPQTWNRYAYVTNNPLALTDPAGLQSGNCSNITYPASVANCVVGAYSQAFPAQVSDYYTAGQPGPFDEFDWSGIPVVEQVGYDWISFGIYQQGPSGYTPGLAEYQSWLIEDAYWGPVFQQVTDLFMIISPPQYLYSVPLGWNPPSLVPAPSPPGPLSSSEVASCGFDPSLHPTVSQFGDPGSSVDRTSATYLSKPAWSKTQNNRMSPTPNPELTQEIDGVALPLQYLSNLTTCKAAGRQ